jgi:hypothetical protein
MACPLALLLLVLAIGGAAAHHTNHFSASSVSPRELQAGGTVALGITYTDASGSAPRSVVARVGDVHKTMTAGAGDFADGVRYTVSLVPAAGRHDVSFTATDAQGNEEVVAGGQVHATAASSPGPSHTPNPTATPRPSPTATPRPSATPVSGAGGGGVGGSGSGDGGHAGPTPAGNGGAPGTGNSTPAPGAGATPLSQKTPAPGAAATPDPERHGQSGSSTGGSTTGSAPPDAGSQTAPDPSADPGAVAALEVTGHGIENSSEWTNGAMTVDGRPIADDFLAPYRHATFQTLLRELAPTIATATAGGTAWAAFMIFGKRRRDGDEPEPESLVTASAVAGVDLAAAHGLMAVDESQIPRWRRPSLQQVRKNDPLRSVAEATHLSFDASAVRPYESYERRKIRYRLVRLLDMPDEVRASETGIIDRGDEVQLLERHGVYWRVLCPDGRIGWLHRMTLGDPDAASAVEIPAPVLAVQAYEAPNIEAITDCRMAVELEPAADRPAAGGGVDGLLEAYMRARGDLVRHLDQPGDEGPLEVEPLACSPVEALQHACSAGAPHVEAPAVALARNYLEKAGFAVQSPETNTETAALVEPAADAGPATTVIVAAEQPLSGTSPASEPERADGKYSARKSAGSRKAASASRPGTKSRRPSR